MKKTILLSAVAALCATSVAATSAKLDQPMAKVEASRVTRVEKVNAPVHPVKTLSSKVMAKGVALKQVRLSDGRVAKVITNNGQMPTVMTPNKPSMKLTKSNALTLEEGFEAWDQEAYDWIPDGWQDISKTDPPHVAPGPDDWPNLTWETTYNGWSAPSHSGEAEGLIQYSYDLDWDEHPVVKSAQDEWLISPEVAIAADDYLAFYLSYSPGFTLWNAAKEDEYYGGNYDLEMFDAENAKLEVLVSTDGGNEWTKVWDCYDHARSLTKEELWADTRIWIHPYIPVLIDMNAYAGQTIRFACRYVGIDGESMLIDDFAVGQLTPEAAYISPDCIFNMGMTTEWTINPQEYMYQLGPVFTPYTWTNTSNLSDTFSWTYSDGSDDDGESKATSTDKDLTTPAYQPATLTQQPELTAVLGNNSSSFTHSYCAIVNGGDFDSHDGTGVYCGVGKYDSKMLHVEGNLADIGIIGVGKPFSDAGDALLHPSSEDATEEGTEEGSEGETEEREKAQVLGVGCVYPLPDAPYALSYVYFNIADYKLSDDALLKVTVWPIDSYGYLGTTELGHGTATAADIVNYDGGLSTILFPIVQEVDGLEIEKPLNITEQIYVELTIETTNDEDYLSLLCIMGSLDEVAETDNSCIRVYDYWESTYSLPSLGFEGNVALQGIIMNLGLTYNWLYEVNNNYYSNVAPEGGDVTFTLNTYIDGTELLDVSGDCTSYTLGDYDTTTGNQDITFHVDALPEGVSERYLTCIASVPGATKKYFTLYQHTESGVASVNVAARNSVAVENGNFVIKSESASQAVIYNVAGQRVASTAVNGTAVVPAANLAHGVYMVKFNDNTVVKVVR